MDGTVLAHLEPGQVESECLGLPDQVLQLSVGLPGRAGVGQGTLDQPEVGEEIGRRVIGQAALARSLQPCGLQPVPGVKQEGAERLARRARSQLAEEVRVGRRRAAQRVSTLATCAMP